MVLFDILSFSCFPHRKDYNRFALKLFSCITWFRRKKKNQKLTEGILSYAHLTQSKPFKETKAAQSLNLERAKIICFLLLSRGRELFSLNFPERASLLRINDLIHPEYCGNLCLKDMVTILLKTIILKLPPSRFVCPSSKLNMVI